jgi:hypothetical protein
MRARVLLGTSVVLALAVSLHRPAGADISRYSQVKVTPVKGNGAEADQVIGFKLRLVLHAEQPNHDKAWVGLVSPKEQLMTVRNEQGVQGKPALYDLNSGHWHQHWTVEGLRQGAPSEHEFTVLYKDNPRLVPGSTYQLAATFPLKGDAPSQWKHSFGADWGGGWGEPSIALPK